MTRRFVVTGLLIGWVLLTASAAPAAEDVLRLVPDAASGFVVINQPSAVDAKAEWLGTLGGSLRAPSLSPLAQIKQVTGAREGWDENATLGLLVLPPDEGTPIPTMILLIPVADYGKFVGQLKPENVAAPVTKIELMQTPGWARNIGGYAALTDGAHKEALESLKLSPQTPAALLPWRQWLAENDVAGVILQPGIKRLSAKVQEGIEMMKSSLANAPEQAKAMAGAFDVYSKMFQAAEKEMTAVGVGVQLDKQNVLRIVSRGLLAPDGKWARLIAQGGPATENLLSGLPAEPFVAAGGGTISKAFSEALMSFSIDMMKNMRDVYGLSEEQIQKMSSSSMMKMKGARAFSAVLGVGKPGESFYAGTIVIMQVDNAAAFLAEYEQGIREYSAVLQAGHSPLLQPIEVEKTEVGGMPALQWTMNAPQLPEGQKVPNYDQIMESFFGPGGKLIAWLVPVDEHHVVMGYVNKEPLLRSVEAIKRGTPGLADDADVKKTAALLPPGALMTIYVSPQGAIQFVQRLVATMAPPEHKPAWNLPEFAKTPPIGIALTTAPNEVRKQVVVPAEVLKAIGQYVGKVGAMSGAAP